MLFHKRNRVTLTSLNAIPISLYSQVAEFSRTRTAVSGIEMLISFARTESA